MAVYTFLNGTDEQKDRWREAGSHFLNTTVELLPVTVDIEFVSPEELAEESGAGSLATTFTTYGDTHSVTKVRNDYPVFGGGDGKLQSLEAEAASWGLTYSNYKHSLETPAHELGHSLFYGMSEADRLRVTRLFGVNSDKPEVINPASYDWANRITEGIADTFKEAFLPARYRVFPNRTNRRIPYRDFPKFRAIFRGGAGVDTKTNDYCYVYGSSSNRRLDLEAKGIGLPVHLGDHDDEAFVEYQEYEEFPSGWGVQMSEFEESGKLPFTIKKVGGDT